MLYSWPLDNLLQAAKLLCSFREYHRRAGLGLASFYGNKLAALEDGLLNAREVLFHVQDEGQGPEQVGAVGCISADIAYAWYACLLLRCSTSSSEQWWPSRAQQEAHRVIGLRSKA